MRGGRDPGRATWRLGAAAVALAVAVLGGAPAAAAELDTPSGQTVTLYEVVLDDETRAARFLFHAPGIALEPEQGRVFDEVVGDFPWLCERVILPSLAENGWEAAQVVISMSDRQVPFGEREPEAVQFFEGFRVEDGGCVLEVF